MRITALLPVLALFFLLGCTPKTTEPLVDNTPKEVKPELTAEELRCRTLNQLGSKKEDAFTAFVLYRNELKAKNYTAAYPIWKKAFNYAPKADGTKSYHYDDGVKILNYFAEQTEEEAKLQVYADSVKMLYERRNECYGESVELKAKEAYDLYYNYRDQVENVYIFNRLRAVADESGGDLPVQYINPFSRTLVQAIIDKDISVEEGKSYANQINATIKKGLADCGTDCKNWKLVEDYSLGRLEVLERFKGFFPCDYYTDKYHQEFLDNATDCDVIESTLIRYKRGLCDEGNTYYDAVYAAYNENCKTVTVKGPLSSAFDAYREGNFEDAVKQFDEYFATETDPEKLAKYQLVVAKIFYRDIKDFPTARKYARDAAKNKANWGEPYILIGKLYASSGPICGPGTGWKSQIVTWPAIDKWNYAKKIDSSVASEANKLIGTYEKFMPAVEDIFSRPNVTEGGPFYVGCWIGENTTARAAK